MPVFNIHCGQWPLTVVPDTTRIECLMLLLDADHSVLSLDERLKRLQINNSDMLVFIRDRGLEVICKALLTCFLYLYFPHAGRIR